MTCVHRQRRQRVLQRKKGTRQPSSLTVLLFCLSDEGAEFTSYAETCLTFQSYSKAASTSAMA